MLSRLMTLCVVLMSAGGVVQAQQAPLPPSELHGLKYERPFFPGSSYNPNVPTPDSVLGYMVGEKAANHREVEAVLNAIVANTPRARLFEYGKTHEGRTLYYIVISTEANMRRLDAIKADAAKLADPRTVSAADGDRIADSMPAIAWMAYAIHGDEMTSTDAALAVAYHLAASTDEAVEKLLSEVVVIIDPLMNPDGRDRWVHGIKESRTKNPSVDDQSVMHGGEWPYGRTNHYLFDMNRDWIFGSQPESRGRITAAGSWSPHYFMESHEMGSQDTFLFMPPREPMNPNIPANVHKWLPRFGREQGQAFDKHGWRYYTGEWNEEWYPGYSGAWGGLRNAVENLYEQARLTVDAVRRPEGVLEAYREGVHKQAVSTMANLTTLAANRREVLRDFVAERRKNVSADGPYAQRVFAVVPTNNAGRMKVFTNLMAMQGFEMQTAGQSFTGAGRDQLGRTFEERSFPAGTLLIPNRQPLANLLAAMLEFDPHMTPEFLEDERRELLRFGNSKLYDITAWNITMMYGLEAYELKMNQLPRGAEKFAAPAVAQQPANAPETTIGFVIDGADDRSVALAGRLMERGVWVRVSNKPFTFDGREYARGSVIVAMHDNQWFGHAGAELGDAVLKAAGELELTVHPIGTGWGDGDLPDLGGEHFVLLHLPRIAVLGHEPFESYSYGEVWHQIDHVLGVRASYINTNDMGGIDLRRYNVLVLPSGDAASVLRDHRQDIHDWVQAGGTLVAIGSSASALAREGGIGSARLLPDVIEKGTAEGGLPDYRLHLIREWKGRNATVDAASVWSHTPPKTLEFPWSGDAGKDQPSTEELKRRDAWRSIFMPQGAIVAGRIDDRSWLTAGCGWEISGTQFDVSQNDRIRKMLEGTDLYMPVLFSRDVVLMAKGRVEAPIRLGVFAPRDNGGEAPTSNTTHFAELPVSLRMSGLLWPEAADRITHAAYVTRERLGSGQVILFANSPAFRAGTIGTARVFSNAVICGPGMGATQPIKP